MTTRPPFSRNILDIDPAQTVENLCAFLKHYVHRILQRAGAVVGVSGGIDSSVCLALSARTFGPQRVLAIMMPERESSRASVQLATELCETFEVPYVIEDLTNGLAGLGAYRKRDEAVSRVFPDYNPAHDKIKLTMPPAGSSGIQSIYYLTVVRPDGSQQTRRLKLPEYLQIVAASNYKQRSRMATLYYHAEALNYAVIGTPNKHEHAQGFFVKFGDGGYDVAPILHLYKTQVYQLAAYLGVPESIRKAKPTTDTYSAEVTQEEFFYQLPFEEMDLLWYAFENHYPPDEVAPVMGRSVEEIVRIFEGFERRARTTEYFRDRGISYPQWAALQG